MSPRTDAARFPFADRVPKQAGLPAIKMQGAKMKLKSICILSAAVLATGFLGGCASSGPFGGTVGSNPRGLSPQLVYEPAEFKQLVWWNAGSFEPVPEHLAAAGRDFCSCQDTDSVKYNAIGYHPYARSASGQPISGGGYLCASEGTK